MMPDLFHGDAVKLNQNMATFSMPTWIKGEFGPKKIPHFPQFIDPIVQAGLNTLHDRFKCKKVALAGFCFGAKYVVRFLKGDKVSAGFIAHPANIGKEELEAITLPLAMAAAEIDQIFPIENRHESEEILKKLGYPWQINIYSSVTHGFAVRCNPNVQAERYAKESAFLQALQWFEEHLRD